MGRGPHNDLVLASGDVSWSHALFRYDGGRLVVEDLGSRNGTFVDGVRIDRPTVLHTDIEVRLGDAVFSWPDDPAPVAARKLMLEDEASRVRYPLQVPRFVIGPSQADLLVPGLERVELQVESNRILLDGRELEIPWSGLLAGRKVRIVEMRSAWTPTLPSAVDGPMRQLKVWLDPPRARLFELPQCVTHTITAEHRVSLLYYLAAARLTDLDAGVGAERCGWRTDASISVAVWGRSGLSSSRNRLNALMYRMRQELVESGLSPDIVEKRPGWARVQPCEVAIDSN